MSAWFFGSRVRGCLFVLFLVVLLRGCAGVRGAGCGWFRVWGSMWCARLFGSARGFLCLCGVGGWACWARLSRECFAGVGLRPVLLRLVGWWGVGRVFSARRSLVLRFRCWSSWSCRGWGFGGCRVGLGFFLRLLLFGPGRCRFLLGCGGWCWLWVVRFLFGEFDPGSGRTLAACLTHASRTGPLLWGRVEWRTGEYHVSNLPSSPG